MSPSRLCVLSRRLQSCGTSQRTSVEIRTEAGFISMVVHQETDDLEQWPNLEEYLLRFLSIQESKGHYFDSLRYTCVTKVYVIRCKIKVLLCCFCFILSKEESQNDWKHWTLNRSFNRANHFRKKKRIEGKSVWSFVKVLLHVWGTVCFLQWS